MPALSLELMLGGVILVSLTFYVLLGGADYGAGLWNLLARGPHAPRQRRLIEDAIGPIWEANHVWLILVITVLFTAFPPAFAMITTWLHIPLTIMLIGIVLRGSAFAFRNHDVKGDPTHAQWRWVFALSSVITPVLLGIVVGAIASGRIGVDGDTFAARFITPWLAPFPLTVGLFALALFSYLAAVYLIVEAREDDLRNDFRRRALLAWTVVALLAGAVFALSGSGAPEVKEDLQSHWGRLVMAAAAMFAVAGAIALLRRRFALARWCAAAEVVAILWGWALAQYPYLVEPHLTIYNAASPPRTLRLLLIALVAGAVVLFPSLYYLYRIFKSRALFHADAPSSASK